MNVVTPLIFRQKPADGEKSNKNKTNNNKNNNNKNRRIQQGMNTFMTDWMKVNLSKRIHDDLIKNLNREMGGPGWMVEDRNKKAYGKDG